jgi:hypothetical protein
MIIRKRSYFNCNYPDYSKLHTVYQQEFKCLKNHVVTIFLGCIADNHSIKQ